MDRSGVVPQGCGFVEHGIDAVHATVLRYFAPVWGPVCVGQYCFDLLYEVVGYVRVGIVSTAWKQNRLS